MLIYNKLTYIDETTSKPLSGLSVTIKDQGSGATATIYSSKAGASSGNPLVTDSNGQVEFWAPRGEYTAVSGIYEDDFTLEEAYGQTELKTVAISAGTVTLNGYEGNAFSTQLTEDVTLAFSNVISSANGVTELTRYLWFVEQDVTGSWEVTFPGSVNWLSGTEQQPETTGVTIYELVTADDGTAWYANKVGALATGFGDASGPASSTDNALARFDGITGKLLQNSTWILADDNSMTAGGQLLMNGNDINLGNQGKLKDVHAGGGITVGESGETALVGFSATSLIGALNENKALLNKLAPDQFVTVGKSGAQYTNITDAQTAITDASPTKQYVIGIYPGIYTGNITQKANIHYMAIGNPETVVLTSSSGNIITCTTDTFYCIGLTLKATGTAKIINIPSGSSATYELYGCRLDYTESGETAYTNMITMASGVLRLLGRCIFTYTSTGTTAGTNCHRFIYQTDAAKYESYDTIFTMSVADATDAGCGIEESSSNTAEQIIDNNTMTIVMSGGGDAEALYLKGTGTRTIFNGRLYLIGNGGTGKTIRTNGDGLSGNLSKNFSSTTGFTLNYAAEVIAPDTGAATWGTAYAEQGTIGDGTLGLIISNAPGIFAANTIAILQQLLATPDIGSFAPGNIANLMNVTVNEVGATGGELHVLDITSTNGSPAEVWGVRTGNDVGPIKQEIGTVVNLGKAWSVDATIWSDRTVAFGTDATNVTLFANDNDYVYLGASTIFNQVQIILNTSANISITPVFEYWNGTTWTTFTPSDGTLGFVQSGVIQFSELTGWATTQVNSEVDGPWYYVRIQRTRNTIVTDPIESTIKISDSSSGDYRWDEGGTVNVKSLKTDVDITNFSNPPTDAELDAAFGTPATVGAGWRKSINDNNGGSNFYEVQSDGSNWWITTWTKAV